MCGILSWANTIGKHGLTGCGCVAGGALVPAQVTVRVDPEWLDREVCIIIRNLQKYFYFHKKELYAVLESWSLFWSLKKMGQFLDFSGKW